MGASCATGGPRRNCASTEKDGIKARIFEGVASKTNSKRVPHNQRVSDGLQWERTRKDNQLLFFGIEGQVFASDATANNMLPTYGIIKRMLKQTKSKQKGDTKLTVKLRISSRAGRQSLRRLNIFPAVSTVSRLLPLFRVPAR